MIELYNIIYNNVTVTSGLNYDSMDERRGADRGACGAMTKPDMLDRQTRLKDS